ncbi:hypothetical protein [uncultured Aquabacterium sp.]|nr:hypothetical protein [uncultured Aquabacterium sp.]
MSIRLSYVEPDGTRVVRWGIWPSVWHAVDWAHDQGLTGASAKPLNP